MIAAAAMALSSVSVIANALPAAHRLPLSGPTRLNNARQCVAGRGAHLRTSAPGDPWTR